MTHLEGGARTAVTVHECISVNWTLSTKWWQFND